MTGTVRPHGPEHIKELEMLGFAVLSQVLDPAKVSELRAAMAEIELRCSSYTDRQWYAHGIEWSESAPVWRLIEHEPTTGFLGDLFGDELMCVGVSYSRTDPGYPGMPLHTDSHPYGSNILGGAGTSPVLVRVLYYLNDLTAERAPLKVVPYSHLSLHADAMPYGRFRSDVEEQMVTCRAGDAVVINQRLFHGVGPNESSTSRALIAVSYRPAWAGPITPLPEPTAAQLEPLPETVRRFLDRPNRGLNDTTIVNWREDLPVGRDGLGPRRWSAKPSAVRAASDVRQTEDAL